MSDSPHTAEQAVIKDFEFLAKEFANLLVASELDAETQQTLLDALPEMKLADMVDLIGMLEAKYVVGETFDLDSALRERLKTIGATFDNEDEAIDAETVKRLEALADSIE
jgi:hypothetical protein